MQDTELLESEKTHFLLPNFPQEFILKGRELWKEIQALDVNGPGSHEVPKMIPLNGSPHFFVRRASRTFIMYKITGPQKRIFQVIDEDDSVEFYVGLAEKYVADPHLDRGRRLCAINLPIDVNYAESFFMIGKYFDHCKYREKPVADSPYQFQLDNSDDPGGKFYYDKEHFEQYSMETPVLFSAKTPHGGRSWAKTPRVVMSIGFAQPLSVIQRKLPKEWF